MEYYTNGLDLYELVDRKVTRKAGLSGDATVAIVLRNCRTEDIVSTDEDALRKLKPVVRQAATARAA